MPIEWNHAAWLAVLGALYEIGGAWILAQAYMAATPSSLLLQSSTPYGGPHPKLFRLFCEQKIDARFSFVLLTIGFLLQSFSSAGLRLTVTWCSVGIVLAILMMVVHRLTRKALVLRTMRSGYKLQYNAEEVQRYVDFAFYDE